MFDTALQQGSSWQAAHEALTRLARARAGLDFEEGEKLRAAERARVNERLGYGSFVEYIERLFGYSPRLTLEKLRVAEELEALPQMAAAFRAASVFGTQTGPRTAGCQTPARPMSRPRPFEG